MTSKSCSLDSADDGWQERQMILLRCPRCGALWHSPRSKEPSIVQDPAQDDLTFRVELSRRDESESGVEAGGAAFAGHMAGEQVSAPVVAN